MIDFRQGYKNQTLLFMVSRYISFGITFVRGILVASILGPLMFGIWGFLTLAQQYLSYTSFGLPYAVNVELATDTSDVEKKRAEIIGASLSITGLIATGILLLGIGLQISGIHLFEKYSFSKYVLAICLVVALNHIQTLFASIYRVYRKLGRIAISELISAIFPLAAAMIFRGSILILALLYALIFAGVLSVIVFIIRMPFKVSFRFNLLFWKQLLSIGIPLLVYNVSFYLITILGRTIIGAFYSVDTMGRYSLANSITSATLLGLNAVAFVVFPEILSKTHAGIPDDYVASVVRKVNDLYGISVFLVVFCVILGLPVLFLVLPQYRSIESTLIILLLSQAVFSVSFGYNCLAIARKKQALVAGISIITAIIVGSLSVVVALLRMNFSWIAIAVLIGSFVFTIWQAELGKTLITKKLKRSDYFPSILPLGILVPILIILFGTFINNSSLAGLIGIIILIISNKRKIRLLWNNVIGKTPKIIKN